MHAVCDVSPRQKVTVFSHGDFHTHAQNQTVLIRLRRKLVQVSLLELFVPNFVLLMKKDWR